MASQPRAWDLPVLAGAGAIRSTVNDLLRFADANLSAPKNKLGDAIKLAWTIHQQLFSWMDQRWCLGWGCNARWHALAQRSDGWIPLDDPDQPGNQDQRCVTDE